MDLNVFLREREDDAQCERDTDMPIDEGTVCTLCEEKAATATVVQWAKGEAVFLWHVCEDC